MIIALIAAIALQAVGPFEHKLYESDTASLAVVPGSVETQLVFSSGDGNAHIDLPPRLTNGTRYRRTDERGCLYEVVRSPATESVVWNVKLQGQCRQDFSGVYWEEGHNAIENVEQAAQSIQSFSTRDHTAEMIRSPVGSVLILIPNGADSSDCADEFCVTMVLDNNQLRTGQTVRDADNQCTFRVEEERVGTQVNLRINVNSNCARDFGVDYNGVYVNDAPEVLL